MDINIFDIITTVTFFVMLYKVSVITIFACMYETGVCNKQK